MRLLDLTIETRHFYLPDDTDLDAFEREIQAEVVAKIDHALAML